MADKKRQILHRALLLSQHVFVTFALYISSPRVQKQQPEEPCLYLDCGRLSLLVHLLLPRHRRLNLQPVLLCAIRLLRL